MVNDETQPRAALLERLLGRYTIWAATYPWRVLAVALALTSVCWALASELRRERNQQAFDLGLDEPCDVQVDDELRALGGSAGDSVLSAVASSHDTAATVTVVADGPPLHRIRERIEREMAAQDRFKSDYF